MNKRTGQWRRMAMPAGLLAFLIFPVACATTGTGANGSGVNSGTTNSNGTSVSGTDISGAAPPATGSSSGTTSSGSSSTYGSGSGSMSTTGSSTMGTTGSSTMGSTSTDTSANYGSTGTTGSGTMGTTGSSTMGSTSTDTSSNSGSSGTTGASSTSGSSFAGTNGSTTGNGSTYGSTGTTGSTYGSTSSGMASSNTNGSYDQDTWHTGGFYGNHDSSGRGHMWGLTVSAVRAQFSNDNSGGNIGGTAGSGNLNSDFGNANGFGLAATTFFSRMLALDLGASYLRPRVNFTPAATGFSTIGGGRLRMIPITALLQLHFLPGSFVDPYVGGGGAYMLLRNTTDFDTNNTGLRRVSYDNRFGGAVQGGLLFGFGGFGLNIDAKYLPLKVRGTGEFNTNSGSTFIGTQGDSKINPWLFSAGLTFGF